MAKDIKTFLLIHIFLTALSYCAAATTRLSNGDIIEVIPINTDDISKVLQSVGNKQPVGIEVIREQTPNNYRGQYYNNYYNQNGGQLNYRPPPPPPPGQQYPNWNPPPYPQQNPYRPYRPNNPQKNNDFVLTKVPNNPNYPEFEIYTLDVKNNENNNQNRYPNRDRYPNNRYPINRYPNENNQYPYIDYGNNNNNNNRDPFPIPYPTPIPTPVPTPNPIPTPNNNDKLIPFGQDDNKKEPTNYKPNPDKKDNETKQTNNFIFPGKDNSEDIIDDQLRKDRVDGYLGKFPVILLNENEIRR